MRNSWIKGIPFKTPLTKIILKLKKRNTSCSSSERKGHSFLAWCRPWLAPLLSFTQHRPSRGQATGTRGAPWMCSRAPAQFQSKAGRGGGRPAGLLSARSPARAAASAAVPTSWWLNFTRYLSVIKKQQYFGSHYKNASLDCIPQGALLRWNVGRCNGCDHVGLPHF